ncbi:MAG: NADH-quinone oxidoreductase subunit I, partial [Wolbachia sp.]
MFKKLAWYWSFVELIKGFVITLKYMFKPKVTLRYPMEKGPL